MNEDRVPYLQLVTTIREKCRRCYTCVRECPAKAIRIADGQASVIQTRCIGCGNCVTVCSQNAKQVLSGIEATEELLAGDAPVAAIVAPSYPAEFTECSTPGLVGALRELGFAGVHEVASAPTSSPRSTCGCWRGARRAATSPPPARRSSATCAVPPGPPRPPRPHRLADAGDRARAAQRSTARGSRSCSSGRASPRRARPATTRSRARSTRRSPSWSCAPLLAARGVSLDGGSRPATTSTRRTASLGALFPISARHAPGGRPRRGPAERRHRESPTAARTSSTPSRDFEHGRPGGAAARRPLLRRLHHGRRH